MPAISFFDCRRLRGAIFFSVETPPFQLPVSVRLLIDIIPTDNE